MDGLRSMSPQQMCVGRAVNGEGALCGMEWGVVDTFTLGQGEEGDY